jgi:hypothetical protein
MTLVSTRPIARAGAAARFAATAALLVATLVSTACFSSETVIRVKADGTGTIEQTNLANKEMLGMAAGMAKQAVKDSNTDADRAPNLDNIGDLFDEAKIREQATTWGQGVRYVSSTPITENGLTGVKAVFAFDDIRLVATNSGAASGAPAPGCASTSRRPRTAPPPSRFACPRRTPPRPTRRLRRPARRSRRSRPRRSPWCGRCSREPT